MQERALEGDLKPLTAGAEEVRRRFVIVARDLSAHERLAPFINAISIRSAIAEAVTSLGASGAMNSLVGKKLNVP